MSDPFIRTRKTIYKLAAGAAAGLAAARDDLLGILDAVSHGTGTQASDLPTIAWLVLLALIVLVYLAFENGGEWILEKAGWLRNFVAQPKDIEGAWLAAVFDGRGRFVAVAETRITYAGGCYQINGADYEFISPTEKKERGRFKATTTAFLEEGGKLIFEYIEGKDTKKSQSNGYGMYIFHNGADSGFTSFDGSFVSEDAKKRSSVKAIRKAAFIKEMSAKDHEEYKKHGKDYPLWLFQLKKQETGGEDPPGKGGRHPVGGSHPVTVDNA